MLKVKSTKGDALFFLQGNSIEDPSIIIESSRPNERDLEETFGTASFTAPTPYRESSQSRILHETLSAYAQGGAPESFELLGKCHKLIPKGHPITIDCFNDRPELTANLNDRKISMTAEIGHTGTWESGNKTLNMEFFIARSLYPLILAMHLSHHPNADKILRTVEGPTIFEKLPKIAIELGL